MNLNRRDFLVLSAAAAATVAAGCANQPIKMEATSFDAGPTSDFATDGIYPGFRTDGFFVVRKDGQLTARSSICTHMGCKVKNQADGTFHCPCHGSDYDANGKVTHGPAVHDLAELPSHVDSNGHLIVTALAKV
jgi:Rieske Fe-S protein